MAKWIKIGSGEFDRVLSTEVVRIRQQATNADIEALVPGAGGAREWVTIHDIDGESVIEFGQLMAALDFEDAA